MRKRKLPVSKQDFEQRVELLVSGIATESERGSVLIGAAFLDEQLELILRKHFPSEPQLVKDIVNPLFANHGPLCSFWAKIKMSYVLRLIPDWAYSDLEIIREIRNRFAHTYDKPSFADEDIIALATRLYAATQLKCFDRYVKSPKPQTFDMQLCEGGQICQLNPEHLRFILSVNYVAGHLQFLVTGKASL